MTLEDEGRAKLEDVMFRIATSGVSSEGEVYFDFRFPNVSIFEYYSNITIDPDEEFLRGKIRLPAFNNSDFSTKTAMKDVANSTALSSGIYSIPFIYRSNSDHYRPHLTITNLPGTIEAIDAVVEFTRAFVLAYPNQKDDESDEDLDSQMV